MSVIATALKHLIAAGVAGDDLVRAVAEIEAELSAVDTRSTGAKRQQRYRDRIAARNEASQSVTSDDSVTHPAPSPFLPPDPQPTPTHTPGDTLPRVQGASGWKVPEGVDPQHWRDFLANRRTKRLGFTATAYRGQLKSLAELADEDWPPGRIVQFAAERGWGAFFDPRGRDDGRRNGTTVGMGGHRGGGQSGARSNDGFLNALHEAADHLGPHH